MVYFTNEQGIGLSTYRRQVNGQLKIEQDLNVLPRDVKRPAEASDLVITPDGKFLRRPAWASAGFRRVSYHVLESVTRKRLG